MRRYIDADIAIKCMKKTFIGASDFAADIRVSAINAINQIPTADVQEVRHGKWFMVEYEYFTCSECSNSYYNGAYSSKEAKEMLANGNTYNYCPRCGARMDKEENEKRNW